MWMPVCGPFREFHLQPLGKCIYLFLQSIVPTLPAAWLTFADGAVYSAYDKPYRLWGISITTDQQLAGAFMKTGGSVFLWAIIIFIFFRRFAANYKDEHDYHRTPAVPAAEIRRHRSDGRGGRRCGPTDDGRRRARVRHHRRADATRSHRTLLTPLAMSETPGYGGFAHRSVVVARRTGRTGVNADR